MSLSKASFGAIKPTTDTQFYLEAALSTLMESLAKQHPKMAKRLLILIVI